MTAVVVRTDVNGVEGTTASSNIGSGVAVVIPCYRVTAHIMGVLQSIGSEVDRIYCVDDKCPEGSGDFIEEHCLDPRVSVLRNSVNLGVGGAVIHGYQRAVQDGAQVIVKIDGDGQMDPGLIPVFVQPILDGEADYTKGNRFFELRQISQMPRLRIFGNASLSLLNKLSSGYWDIFDPTNGYTAIHADVARRLPAGKLSKRYFFESDMLFRLNSLRAVVVDVPMDAYYGDEESGIKVSKILGEFAYKHLRNLGKRIAYNYVLRDLPLATLELFAGILLLSFGALFGGWHWWISASSGISATPGTVMIAVMCILVGLQLVLAFLSYDIASVPRRPVHKMLAKKYAGLQRDEDKAK